MKEYINQIFYEGLGKSLYYPIENKIKKSKNNNIKNKLIIVTKIIYFIFSLILALILFYIRL